MKGWGIVLALALGCSGGADEAGGGVQDAGATGGTDSGGKAGSGAQGGSGGSGGGSAGVGGSGGSGATGGNVGGGTGGSAGEATGGSGGGCQQGDTRTCLGPGACSGAQACDALGLWGACDCGVASGGSGGGTQDAGGGTGGGADAATEKVLWSIEHRWQSTQTFCCEYRNTGVCEFRFRAQLTGNVQQSAELGTDESVPAGELGSTDYDGSAVDPWLTGSQDYAVSLSVFCPVVSPIKSGVSSVYMPYDEAVPLELQGKTIMTVRRTLLANNVGDLVSGTQSVDFWVRWDVIGY